MKIINHFISIIFLILLINYNNNNNKVNGQYQYDVCVVNTNRTGLIQATRVIPQICYRLVPTVGKAYLSDSITINILSATLGENSVIKVIEGSNILSDDPVLTINETLSDSLEPITINSGMVIIFLDSLSSGNETVGESFFTISYASSNEKHLKPSVVGLISVAVAFGVPLVVVTFIKCLIPNSTKKEKATSIKKIFFWISFILGLVFLAIILSRKAGV